MNAFTLVPLSRYMCVIRFHFCCKMFESDSPNTNLNKTIESQTVVMYLTLERSGEINVTFRKPNFPFTFQMQQVGLQFHLL